MTHARGMTQMIRGPNDMLRIIDTEGMLGGKEHLGGYMMAAIGLDQCPHVTNKSVWYDCREGRGSKIKYPFSLIRLLVFLTTRRPQ